MTSEQIIAWAKSHHAMIHFWHKIVVYLPGYRHTTGDTPEEAIAAMQEQIERVRRRHREEQAS